MFDQLTSWLMDNWMKGLGLLTFLTVLPAYFRARYLWKRRQFLTRINFSLNFIEDGTLKFRTLRETDLAHALWNNAHAIRMLLKTVRGKRPGAFLLFQDKEEAWTILTTLLNEISGQFAEGFLARSMGIPTRSEWHLFGLTCEKHGDLKSTKIRVMIVPKKTLEELDTYRDLRFEQPHHHIRLATLKEMAQVYRTPEQKFNLMEVEVTAKTGVDGG